MVPLIATGVGALGNILGGIFGGGAANAAQQQATAQANRIQNMDVPDINEQMLALQKLQRGEQLTPAEMAAAQVSGSAFEDINTDPRLKQAQLDALTSLQGISNSGGLQLSDQANLQKLMGQAASGDKGRRDAIMQSMQERGMGGSGNELAAKLASAQDASMQQNQAATDTAATAQQRALQAIQQGGQLAGNIRGQDLSQEQAKAQALDAINKFNASNSQQANQVNNQNQMQANQYNTERGNSVLDQNVGLANQEQAANKSLYQQQFQNNLAKQQAASNATKEQAQQTVNAGNTLASGIGNTATGLMQALSPDQKKKAGVL